MARKTNKIDFAAVATNTLGLAGGGVATRVLTKRLLPSTMNPVIKNLIPSAVGIALPMFIKNPLVDAIANGMIAVGAADIVSNLGTPAPESVSGIANEYGIGNMADEMALYEETTAIGSPEDAFNSLAGIGNFNYPSPWGSNPTRATQESLAGIDDDKNSILGFEPVDAGLASEYGVAGM